MEKKQQYYSNGNIEIEWTEKNDKIHGEWKLYFENGEIRKKSKYEDGVCVFLEEYHLNGTMVRKGSLKDGKECGDWEYYNAKDGKKINKDEYESKWYENLPDQFTDFICYDEMIPHGYAKDGVDGVYKDQNTGEIKNIVKEYYQICENMIILSKNGEEVDDDSAYEITLFSNVWSEEYEQYSREEEASYVITDVDYDDFHVEEEQELERYTDLGYAQDAFNKHIRGL